MKFKLKVISVLALVFMMIGGSSAYAVEDSDIVFAESCIDELGVQYNEDVKTTCDKLLEKSYLTKDEGYELTNTNKVVLINKIFDADTIKQSYEKPVILYKEEVENTYNSYEPVVLSSYTIEIKEVVENTSYAYAGIVISVSSKLEAEILKDGSIDYYKLKSITNSWETSNSAADGFGGYVNSIYSYTLQFGNAYETGSGENCVDFDYSRTFPSDRISDYEKNHFRPDYHTSATTGGAGLCGEYVELGIKFVNSSAPNQIYTMSDSYNVGWGGIWSPF
jgi:hypothetical protein